MSKTSLPQTPTVDSDYALAEPVGDNLHRLYLIADWQRATICFETRHESENGIPMRQWHGHQASWHTPIMGRTMATELLEELRPLVARVCTGYSGQWDGQNHVARFDDDAQDTRDEIDRVIDNLDWQDTGTGGLWAAGDWLQGDPPTVAVDTNMKELSAEMQGTAHYEAIHLHGLDTYLEELQAEAREQAGDCAHDWTPTDTEPAVAGSTGYAVACRSCGATGWQPASWRTGAGGVHGFWPVGDVQIGGAA